MKSNYRLRDLHRKRKKRKELRRNPSAESICRRYFEVQQLRQRLLEAEAGRVVR